MEGRIRQLESLLKNAEIVEGGDTRRGAAGSIVAIRYEGDDDDRALPHRLHRGTRSTGSRSSRPGRRSARRCIGHKVGDIVDYDAPARALKVEIVTIESEQPSRRTVVAAPSIAACRSLTSSFPARHHVRPRAPARRAHRRSCSCTDWRRPRDLNWFASFRPTRPSATGSSRIDHRGHGRGIRTRRLFRLADCADDVAALADELGIEQLHRGRLLDGRTDRPAVLAPASARGSTGSCSARPRRDFSSARAKQGLFCADAVHGPASRLDPRCRAPGRR